MLAKKLFLFFLFVFSTEFVHAQLSNFTLTVTPTNETCPSNGALAFSVSNTTAGSTLLYEVYLLPNVTTPISVQSTNSISGLTAGNYRVIATQSLGGQSGTQQQDVTIANSITLLTYQLSGTNEICGNDGTITATVTTGTALSYEIFSGPMTRPAQSSNLFTGLTAGVYQIKLIDVCGQAVVQTYTLFRTDTALNFSLINPNLASCNMANIGANFQTALQSGVIRFPLQITIVFSPPSGPSVTYNQILASGNNFIQQVPYFPNQTSSYTFTITDGCGRVYNLNGLIQNLQPLGAPGYDISPQDCVLQMIHFTHVASLILVSAPSAYSGSVPQNFTPSIVNLEVTVHDIVPGTYVFNLIDGCGIAHTMTIVVDPIQAITPVSLLANQTCFDATAFVFDITQIIMTSAPATYTVALPHDYTSTINSAHYAAFVHLPIGTYVFTVADMCGNPTTISVIVTAQTSGPTPNVLEGCANGEGSFRMQGDFVSLSITAAPSAYSGNVPVDLMGSLISNGTILVMDTLPPGLYTFQSTNSCGNTFTTNLTIEGYQQNTNATLTPNCGSFNLIFNHTSNNTSTASYWLQKFDNANGNWVHPLTDVAYANGTFPNATNSVQLTNNVMNYNLAYVGHFRILKVFHVYISGNPSAVDCFKTIYEFDFYNVPRIIDVVPVSCGATFDVVVNATGNSALLYRIVAKNNLPFFIDNGNSNVFAGLQPAIYTFEVEDVCHNSANSQFQVLSPEPMTVASTVTCGGQAGSLSVPGFSFLSYQWWEGSNTTTILSTTSTLNFPSFNPTLNNGTYHVRIIYAGNPGSCLNQVLDYTVNLGSNAPNAGNDNSVSYCGRQGILDMNALLIGIFDTNGSWTEVTSSGMLTNNLWDSSVVPYGNYQFKYTVVGNCSQTDDATIDIEIKEIPQVPVASADPIICVGGNVNLYATSVANGTYHWVGPNSFASSEQNPVLNAIAASANGTYTVYSSYNGCQSGNSSVEVFVNPLPEFTLNQDCVNREYQVWAIKTNEASYNENLAVFSWTGPNSFSSSQNPIQISGGYTGIYSLTITNEFGCRATNSIDVTRTHCFIPNVITPNNDDTNESLDLTGFDVIKLEIYSRWGRKVYEKNNYINEWHGQNMNGDRLPDSTYYYLIELPDEGTKVGWIFVNGSR